MKPTPTDFRRWQIHIRKECVFCSTAPTAPKPFLRGE